MLTYIFLDLQADVQNEVHGSLQPGDWIRIINRGVKATLNDVDLRSAKRQKELESGPIIKNSYDYDDIPDLKGIKIISLLNVLSDQDSTEDFELLSPDEFDRLKTLRTGIMALDEIDGVKSLRASSVETNFESYVNYYSSYLWITSGGTRILDSSSATDKINVEPDEYAIIVEKCAELAARKLDNKQDADDLRQRYIDDVKAYQMNYPSEAKLLTTTYYQF